MSISVPTGNQRWRCKQCGNLTRFDVTRTVRARDYLHFDLSGEGQVEEREVLAETVELVDRPAADEAANGSGSVAHP